MKRIRFKTKIDDKKNDKLNQQNNDIDNYNASSHDHQQLIIIIESQKETISKLNEWIEQTGRASIEKVKQLELDNDGLREDNNKKDMIIASLNSELLDIQKTNKQSFLTKQKVLNDAELENLVEELKTTQHDLQDTKKDLEKYYLKDNQSVSLQNQLKQLNKLNENIRKENSNLISLNKLLEDSITSLKHQINIKDGLLNKNDIKISNYFQEIEDLNKIILSQKEKINEEIELIDDLQENYQLATTSDILSYEPVTKDTAKTFRLSTIHNLGFSLLGQDPLDVIVADDDNNNNNNVRAGHNQTSSVASLSLFGNVFATKKTLRLANINSLSQYGDDDDDIKVDQDNDNDTDSDTGYNYSTQLTALLKENEDKDKLITLLENKLKQNKDQLFELENKYKLLENENIKLQNIVLQEMMDKQDKSVIGTIQSDPINKTDNKTQKKQKKNKLDKKKHFLFIFS